MGSWTYYALKMSARELSSNVRYAYEVYEDRTLDEAIQRALNELRVKRDIVTYLKRRADRFFSALVVAALDGDPKFYPVRIADDVQFQIFAEDEKLNESFGVLRFDGTQKYYALDGQHRLAAIKTVLDKNDQLSDGTPESLGDDELTVLVVVPSADEKPLFMQKYRRLFSSLNRYAKPTDQATNIIMDEDDALAIITRRLITEHPFFSSSGRQMESRRIKTTKGKNLSARDPFFTSIEALYEINCVLLLSKERENRGWDRAGEGEDFNTFKKFRPDEEHLDSLYAELVLLWNAVLHEMPGLQKDPINMRKHDLPDDDDSGDMDSVLFWPIGQELLAKIARTRVDRHFTEHPEAGFDAPNLAQALRGLGQVDWELHHPPWRYLLLKDTSADPNRHSWKMRNEDRKEALRIAERLVLWMLGHDELGQDDEAQLKLEWKSRLIPAMPAQEEDDMWGVAEEQRARIASYINR